MLKLNALYSKKYQTHIPYSFPYKVVCLMINLAKKLFLLKKKMQPINLLKQFLKSMIIAKK